jgi:hypothetical protein
VNPALTFALTWSRRVGSMDSFCRIVPPVVNVGAARLIAWARRRA